MLSKPLVGQSNSISMSLSSYKVLIGLFKPLPLSIQMRAMLPTSTLFEGWHYLVSYHFDNSWKGWRATNARWGLLRLGTQYQES